MSPRAVTFDTNAYRDLCRTVLPEGNWTVEGIRAAEAGRSHLVLASPYVIMELAAHLADEADPAFKQCRCALSALARHCQVGNDERIYLVADSESLVAKSLFDADDQDYGKTTEVLARLAFAVARSDPAKSLPTGVADKCKEIKDYVDKREQQFVSDMQGHVVRSMNPSCGGWVPFAQHDPKQPQVLDLVRSATMLDMIATGFVIKAAAQTGNVLSPDEIRDMSKSLADHAGSSIRLYREILERLVNTGCNLTKPERANWIWDMQIAIGIGEDMGGEDCGTADCLLLVTGDDAIVQAAIAASQAGYVSSLTEYLNAL